MKVARFQIVRGSSNYIPDHLCGSALLIYTHRVIDLDAHRLHKFSGVPSGYYCRSFDIWDGPRGQVDPGGQGGQGGGEVGCGLDEEIEVKLVKLAAEVGQINGVGEVEQAVIVLQVVEVVLVTPPGPSCQVSQVDSVVQKGFQQAVPLRGQHNLQFQQKLQEIPIDQRDI